MQPGDVLAERFVIEKLADSGGMGDVYKGRDVRTDKPVAVKVLRGPADAARFAREAWILERIDHPRVVRHIAYDALPTGEPYLVMEWLEGEDLSTRLERGRLTAAEAVALVAKVAETLGALHEQGIVHRDLKPSNVFLEGRQLDRVKLLDFGVAHDHRATRLTGTGMLVGTAAYMAPEQARGSANVDARADVFSLGCLLYECVSGQPAFTGAHPVAILAKILFEEPPPLREQLVGLPAELDEMMGRLLSKDSEERPANGHAVAAALRALSRLPDVALEATSLEQRRTALTTSEQRAVAVLFINAPKEAAQPSSEVRLATEAANYGGMFAKLADGSVAVVLSGTSVATDLVAQAARCALAMNHHAPDRRIALSMGRGELSTRHSMAQAIDRAARMLDSGATPATGFESGVVTLDEATVGLLDARFDIGDSSGVFILRGERDVTEVRTLLGKPTPCVGRERELRSLEQLFEDCLEQGGAQVALVTAPPGVGNRASAVSSSDTCEGATATSRSGPRAPSRYAQAHRTACSRSSCSRRWASREASPRRSGRARCSRRRAKLVKSRIAAGSPNFWARSWGRSSRTNRACLCGRRGSIRRS